MSRISVSKLFWRSITTTGGHPATETCDPACGDFWVGLDKMSCANDWLKVPSNFKRTDESHDFVGGNCTDAPLREAVYLGDLRYIDLSVFNFTSPHYGQPPFPTLWNEGIPDERMQNCNFLDLYQVAVGTGGLEVHNKLPMDGCCWEMGSSLCDPTRDYRPGHNSPLGPYITFTDPFIHIDRPDCAINIYPEDEATNISVNPILQWAPGEGGAPDSYLLTAWKLLGGGTSSLLASTKAMASPYRFAHHLDWGSEYRWGVLPSNMAGKPSTGSCSEWTFKTLYPPACDEHLFPIDGSDDDAAYTSGRQPLIWTPGVVDDTHGQATWYSLLVEEWSVTYGPDGNILTSSSTSAHGEEFFYGNTWLPTRGMFNPDQVGWNHTKIYKWWTLPGNDAGQCPDICAGTTFRTIRKPECPTVISQLCNNDPSTGITLTWVPSTSVPITSYRVHYEQTQGGTATDTIDTTANTFRIPESPAYGVAFDVTISALNEAGVSEGCVPVTATTLGAPNPPCPCLNYPNKGPAACDDTSINEFPTPTRDVVFTWGQTFHEGQGDCDSVPVPKYDMILLDAGTGTTRSYHNIAGTSVVVDLLEPSMDYVWKACPTSGGQQGAIATQKYDIITPSSSSAAARQCLWQDCIGTFSGQPIQAIKVFVSIPFESGSEILQIWAEDWIGGSVHSTVLWPQPSPPWPVPNPEEIPLDKSGWVTIPTGFTPGGTALIKVRHHITGYGFQSRGTYTIMAISGVDTCPNCDTQVFTTEPLPSCRAILFPAQDQRHLSKSNLRMQWAQATGDLLYKVELRKMVTPGESSTDWSSASSMNGYCTVQPSQPLVGLDWSSKYCARITAYNSNGSGECDSLHCFYTETSACCPELTYPGEGDILDVGTTMLTWQQHEQPDSSCGIATEYEVYVPWKRLSSTSAHGEKCPEGFTWNATDLYCYAISKTNTTSWPLYGAPGGSYKWKVKGKSIADMDAGDEFGREWLWDDRSSTVAGWGGDPGAEPYPQECRPGTFRIGGDAGAMEIVVCSCHQPTHEADVFFFDGDVLKMHTDCYCTEDPDEAAAQGKKVIWLNKKTTNPVNDKIVVNMVKCPDVR